MTFCLIDGQRNIYGNEMCAMASSYCAWFGMPLNIIFHEVGV